MMLIEALIRIIACKQSQLHVTAKLQLYVVCRLVSQQTLETCVGMRKEITTYSSLAHIFLALMMRGWNL